MVFATAWIIAGGYIGGAAGVGLNMFLPDRRKSAGHILAGIAIGVLVFALLTLTFP